MKEIVKYFGKSCASSKQGMVLEKGRDPESESYEDGKKSLSLVSHMRNDLYFSMQKNKQKQKQSSRCSAEYCVNLSAVAS